MCKARAINDPHMQCPSYICLLTIINLEGKDINDDNNGYLNLQALSLDVKTYFAF